jgi:GT2 family glycosyltransferase
VDAKPGIRDEIQNKPSDMPESDFRHIPGGSEDAAYRLFAVFVVVIYNTRMSESVTLLSLAASLESVSDFNYRVLIFDNSSNSDHESLVSVKRCTIVWCGENRGLARAYNEGLAYSIRHGGEVLVTLDQDSTVSPEYLKALFEHRLSLRDPVVALCPTLVSGGRVISPYEVNVFGRRRYGRCGINPRALNSFSVYSVAFLKSIGGFEEFYTLDGLDFSTYARIAKLGKKVFVLPAVVNHELSLLSGRMDISRFTNMTYYEACSLAEYDGPLSAASGTARMLVRAVRNAPKGRHIRYLRSAAAAVVLGLAAGIGRRRAAGVARLA